MALAGDDQSNEPEAKVDIRAVCEIRSFVGLITRFLNLGKLGIKSTFCFVMVKINPRFLRGPLFDYSLSCASVGGSPSSGNITFALSLSNVFSTASCCAVFASMVAACRVI